MPAEPDYTREQFAEALASVGLKPGDTVFSHSNVGYFGRPAAGLTAAGLLDTIYGAFTDVLGEDGTLVVPTYTYSFSQGRVFDYDNSPGDCGLFTELVRTMPESIRSEDPHVSVAAVGKRALELTGDLPSNAYDPDAFFGRLYSTGGVICNLNFDAGSTFLHYVERCLKVPYRYDKTFAGVFCRNGHRENREATIWVRDTSSDETIAAFEPFDEFARDRGLFRTAQVGRGAIGMISTADCYALVQDLLPAHPWVLTRAHASGVIPVLTPR